MRELIEYRRLTSKIFDLPGRRYRCQTHIGPVHYRVDPLDVKEPWKDIDRTLVSDVAGIRCLSNTYQVHVVEKNLDLGVRALAEFTYRGKKMTIAPVALEYRNAAGAAQTLSTGADVKPVVSGNSVTWPDVFGKGIDFGYTVSHLGFQKVVTIHQTESLPTPKIDSKGLRLCAVLSMAWDSTANAPAACAGVTAERVSADFSGQEVSLITAASKEAPSLAWGEYWKLHPAKAWDAGGKEITASLDVVSRGGRPFAVVGVAMADLEGAKFPVSIDPTLDPIPVADAGDDFTVLIAIPPPYSGNVWAGDIIVNGECSAKSNAAMRFTEVAIPAGATIDSASLRLVAAGGEFDSGGVIKGYLRARAVANCPAMTTNADYRDETTYPWGTESVEWYPATWVLNNNYDSPDIKSVIQEVVDIEGWASGNALQLCWYYGGAWEAHYDEDEDDWAHDYRFAYAYEHPTYNPPILNVEYTSLNVQHGAVGTIIL